MSLPMIQIAPTKPTYWTSEPQSSRNVEESITYMMAHLDQPLQVARLAGMANLSPSHYFALFKRRTGRAPIEFFIHLRMHHACQLLETTALNVKEVAAALGYEDPFYFSRVFKSVNQIAPSRYRSLPQEVKDAVRSAAWPRGSVDLSAPEVPLAVQQRRSSGSAGLSTAAESEYEDRNKSVLHQKQSILHSAKENICHRKRNLSHVT